MREPTGWSRRDLLKVGAAAGGGLLASIVVPGCRPSGSGRPAGAGTGVTVFVRLHPDGWITVQAPKIEMGQGTRTSLPMILAEELDVAWERVLVEPAPLDQTRFGWQGAGGSTSVWTSWEPLRKAGAAVRAMLRRAAAERWAVPVDEVDATLGRVRHAASGRSAAYGELAAAAAALPVPDDPPLKAPETFRIIGRPVRQAGIEAIVTGAEAYAWDTRRPGMLRVAVQRGPLGATVRAVRDARARAVAGVRGVVQLDRERHPALLWHGVAVVADTSWAAFEGQRALEVEWSGGATPADSDALAAALRAAVDRPGRVLARAGDVERGLRASATVVDAVYELPLLAHAPMETNAAFADVQPDRVIVRGPFQDPDAMRAAAAELTGRPPEQVTVEPCRLGGGFGRRLPVDYGVEAVVLALAAGAPVQVIWSREDDVRFDQFRPAAAHRLTAGLDPDGRIVAWRHRKASTSLRRFRDPTTDRPEHYELYPDDPPAGLVPGYQLEYTPLETPVALGTWRSVVHSGNAFAWQGFVDELARAAGRDPLVFQQTLLGPDRVLPYAQHGGPGWNPGRLRRVLELAAAAARWDAAPPPGRARGLAGHFTFGSYAAMVAEVSVDADGRIRVHRVVAAIDCGTPVNPLGIEAQVAGGILYGLSAALYGEITFRHGVVDQGNFDSYPVVRLPDAPAIDVHIVPSREPPRGTGETATPPILPAVANAVFAATGLRLRRPPFSPERVRAARARSAPPRHESPAG